MDRDIELTRIVDNLETARIAAEALRLDLLHYLIVVALDEAKEVVAKGKTGDVLGAALKARAAE